MNVLISSAAVVLCIILGICIYFMLTPVLLIPDIEQRVTLSKSADLFELFMYKGNYYMYAGLLAYENMVLSPMKYCKRYLVRNWMCRVSKDFYSLA